jgi:dephospho-CoA kinase
MKIICITGKAGAGRDTLADIMKTNFEFMGYKVLITHFAGILKFVCKEWCGWNGLKNEEGKTLLQRVRTNIVRAQDKNYWVNFMCDMLRFFGAEFDYIIIPDCRFINEYEVLREKGYDVSVVKIKRPNTEGGLTEEQSNHISEKEQDKIKADYVIDNSKDILALRSKTFLLLTNFIVQEKIEI